ncbi:MAG: hypothetical protein HQL56_18250 [Magnetococcales bacterium]|nr:hypothetical protein [Magnetococcales bacterium]
MTITKEELFLRRNESSPKHVQEETVTAGGTSSVYRIPEGAHPTVAIHPVSGGTAVVQFTTSLPSKVAAGTANWVSWDHGSVSASKADFIQGQITALRATATTQNAVLEVIY